MDKKIAVLYEISPSVFIVAWRLVQLRLYCFNKTRCTGTIVPIFSAIPTVIKPPNNKFSGPMALKASLCLSLIRLALTKIVFRRVSSKCRVKFKGSRVSWNENKLRKHSRTIIKPWRSKANNPKSIKNTQTMKENNLWRKPCCEGPVRTCSKSLITTVGWGTQLSSTKSPLTMKYAARLKVLILLTVLKHPQLHRHQKVKITPENIWHSERLSLSNMLLHFWRHTKRAKTKVIRPLWVHRGPLLRTWKSKNTDAHLPSIKHIQEGTQLKHQLWAKIVLKPKTKNFLSPLMT